MKNIRLTKRFILSILIIVLFCAFTFPVCAESIPYSSYTYWEGYDNKTPVETKAVFEPRLSFEGRDIGVGNFKNIQQITSVGSNLYVVDSGNNRIVVLNNSYELVRVIDSIKYNEEILSLSGVRGVYAYEDEIFIADTDNKRVICCKNDDVFKIIEKPKSNTIPDDFVFAPTRILKDKNGYLYVLCDGSYYGMMVFSNDYEFRGFFGANMVTKSVFGAIKELVTSIFETEEKHNASLQALPYQIADICLDYKGHICAINASQEGQLKRYGTDGSNVLIYNEQFEGLNADSYNFGDFPTGYVDTTRKYSSYIEQKFTALCSDSEGYLYAVDSTQGRIFMYDMNCKLITVFGGGVGEGNQLGNFITANSITVSKNQLLVSDFVSGRITVFELTEYGQKLKIANNLSVAGKDIEAENYWKEINKQDKNCQLAYKGLAKAALENSNYDSAMQYAKIGLDRVTYAQAFKVVRNDFIGKNFWWISILTVSVIGAITFLLIYTKKHEIVVLKNPYINTVFEVIFHPIECFKNIKFSNRGSLIIAGILILFFYISSVVKKLNSGFMFSIVNYSEFNSIYIFLGTVGVVILWIVVNWIVCMLSDGKGTLKDVICSVGCCLMPKIIENILFLILSHWSIATSNSAFQTLSVVCTLWMIVLLLLSMTVIQDYSFFRSLGMSVVSIIGMVIGAFVIFVVLTLSQDLLGFVIGIIKEVVLR